MSRDVLVQRDTNANRRPGVRECDVECATQLADALAHALNADLERLGQQRAVLMRHLVTTPASWSSTSSATVSVLVVSVIEAVVLDA